MEDQNTIFNFEKLSTAEKILRLQEAWDRIAENPDEVEVTEAQKMELDSRIEKMEENPDEGTAWETIKKEIHKDK